MIPNLLCGVGVTGPCSEALGCCPFTWACTLDRGAVLYLLLCGDCPNQAAQQAQVLEQVIKFRINLEGLSSSKGFVICVLSLACLVKLWELSC